MAEVQLNVAALNRFLAGTVQNYLFIKAEEIAREAKSLAPHGATGDLQQSIHAVRGPKNSVSVKVDAPYAGFVHDGTGPGHKPNPNPTYFPKLRRRGLIAWSESKSVNPYKVAHGISENGTPAKPFLEESVQKILGRFQFKWIRKDLNT